LIFLGGVKVVSKICIRLVTEFYSFLGFLKLRQKVIAFGSFDVANAKNIHLGQNVRINRGVYILARSRVDIGSNVVLSAEAMILDTGLDVDAFMSGKTEEHLDSFVKIEDQVWIGARALILPGVTIGHHSVIAAGSVVNKDVAPYTVVAGVPAEKIKDLR
jgi:acetyltransferase-like isoleucine patch superfamily enzyme